MVGEKIQNIFPKWCMEPEDERLGTWEYGPPGGGILSSCKCGFVVVYQGRIHKNIALKKQPYVIQSYPG